jgi:hypothetical protein
MANIESAGTGADDFGARRAGTEQDGDGDDRGQAGSHWLFPLPHGPVRRSRIVILVGEGW